MAVANAQGSVSGNSRPLTCTLSFGSVVEQSISIPNTTSPPVEMSLQGAGELTGGTIHLACSSAGGKATVSNISLIAYVVSSIN